MKKQANPAPPKDTQRPPPPPAPPAPPKSNTDRWVDIECYLPPTEDAQAWSRYGHIKDIKRHIESYLSDGKIVWVGRVNHGSMTVDGREDETGGIVTHWMPRQKEVFPQPPTT